MPAVFSAKPTFLSTQSLLRSATPSAAALNGRSKTTFISPQRNTASDTGTSTAPPAQSQPKYHDRNAVSATDTTSSRNSGCPHGCAACCFIKLCVFHIICIILNIHISKQSSAAGRGLRISIALIRAVCEPIGAEICPQGLKETRFPCPRAVPAALWYHTEPKDGAYFFCTTDKRSALQSQRLCGCLGCLRRALPPTQAASEPQLSPFE